MPASPNVLYGSSRSCLCSMHKRTDIDRLRFIDTPKYRLVPDQHVVVTFDHAVGCPGPFEGPWFVDVIGFRLRTIQPAKIAAIRTEKAFDSVFGLIVDFDFLDVVRDGLATRADAIAVVGNKYLGIRGFNHFVHKINHSSILVDWIL